MARVTVEDCLEKIPSRFALVVLAARRTRQLLKGADRRVKSKNKVAVTALREIAAGIVYPDKDVQELVEQLIETDAAGQPQY